MNFTNSPFVSEMKEVTANMYRQGWDERNGGNISVILTDEENNEVDKTLYKGVNAKENLQKDTHYLDISGIVKDNAVFGSNAYDGQGMTVSEYLQEKGAGGDLAAIGEGSPMLRRNYLAVMSNSLSTEDFAKLKENGYHMGSMEIKKTYSAFFSSAVRISVIGQVPLSRQRGHFT